MIGKERFELIKQNAPYQEWANWVEPILVSAGVRVNVRYHDETCLGLFEVVDRKRFIHHQFHSLKQETVSMIGVPLNGLVGELEPRVKFFRESLITADPRVRATVIAFTLTHQRILGELLNHSASSDEISTLKQLKEAYSVSSSKFLQRNFDFNTWLNQLSQ
jgi:hypothetical protein